MEPTFWQRLKQATNSKQVRKTDDAKDREEKEGGEGRSGVWVGEGAVFSFRQRASRDSTEQVMSEQGYDGNEGV